MFSIITLSITFLLGKDSNTDLNNLLQRFCHSLLTFILTSILDKQRVQVRKNTRRTSTDVNLLSYLMTEHNRSIQQMNLWFSFITLNRSFLLGKNSNTDSKNLLQKYLHFANICFYFHFGHATC